MEAVQEVYLAIIYLRMILWQEDGVTQTQDWKHEHNRVWKEVIGFFKVCGIY